MNSLRLRASAALSAVAFSMAPVAVRAQTAPPASAPSVLVVGGTPAGVAAAVAAARRGETVELVASGGDLGGVLTGAMMDQWDLNVAPDGAPVENGLFEEIEARLGDAFAPETAARELAAFVAAEPRISVRYHERPVRVETTSLPDGNCIDGVTFANASTGDATTATAPYVIDATDDGDVAALAGARYDLGRQDSGLDDRMQAVTLMFAVSGVDWRELVTTYDPATFGPGGAIDRRAWGYSKTVAPFAPRATSVLVRDLNFGMMPDGDVSVNAIDVVGIDGLNAADLARARALAEPEAYRLVAFLHARLPGFARARVDGFAPDVYVRETRHVAGLERLTTSDVWLGKIPSDSIGLSSYPIDLHPIDATDAQPFAPVRHVYGIPFGTMVPRGFDNLVLASPAISASHLAAGSARVIPTTIEEGEAAGAAAAEADRERIDFVSIATNPTNVVRLRRDLAQHAVLLRVPNAVTVARA